jgi:hypothetical protein
MRHITQRLMHTQSSNFSVIIISKANCCRFCTSCPIGGLHCVIEFQRFTGLI